jgi:hypothetical protein
MDLRCSHGGGMSLVMEENETFDPVDVSSFCANAVMFEVNLVTHEVKEFWLVVHQCTTV